MATLADHLRHRTGPRGRAPLFSHADGTRRLTYDQCWHIVAEHEKWLSSVVDDRCRVAVGAEGTVEDDAVVGYLGDNSPDLLLSVLACMHLTARSASSNDAFRGGRALPAMINARWTPSEMERALRPSDASTNNAGRDLSRVHVTIVLYGLGYERAAQEAVRLMNRRRKLPNGTSRASHYAVALPLPEFANKYYEANADSGAPFMNNNEKTVEAECISNDDALLLFTSGTSSPNGAKGVRLSHRSLLVQARAKTEHPCGYDDQTRVVATTVPWFHVGGMSSALAVILGGGCLVFPPDDMNDGARRGFQPKRILETIQPRSRQSSTAANTLVVVPAMLHAIAEYVQKNSPGPMAFPNVRLILVGGQSIGNGRLYKQTRQLFLEARIVQTYACTEAGSSITFEELGWKYDVNASSSVDENSQEDGLDGATSVGHPPPHIQVGIFDADTNTSLPDGKMGIIGTRGPHVMSGYWDRGGGNATALNPNNNWMLTNDLGYIHPKSGKLYFCGRANDVIRTGGESVPATEVERIIGTHEDIAECAVFALPDAKFGEAVCAAVVPEKAPSNPLPDRAVEDEQWKRMLRQHCAKHQLAGFKRPRRVYVMRALPRNSSSKVLKHEIVRLCAAQSKQRSRL